MLRSLLFLVSVVFSISASAVSYSFAVLGDAGLFNESTSLVQKSVIKHQVRNLILPGDNLYSEAQTYDKAWGPWKTKGFIFPVVAIGNHNDGYQNEINFFSMPSEFYAKTVDGFTRFIVLNSDNEANVQIQLRWLDEQLKTTTEQFNFIVYHHPTYTLTKRHTWDEKKDFQLGMQLLLKKHRKKITALLLGHDHIASLVMFGDLPAVVSGAAHESKKANPVNNVQNGTPIKTSWLWPDEPYWVRLDLDKTKMDALVHFVRASDSSVSCSFRLVTGGLPQAGTNCLNRLPNEM